MSMSVAIKSLAVDRLEAKAGKRRRKRKRRGDPYPLEKTRSGGGKKSKRKGASFESLIAKQWKAYYGCSVRRTPGSGGWGTVGGDDWNVVKGDLVFARKAPYHIECKKHEGWDLTDLITGVRGLNTTSTNSLEKWWAQCTRDCPPKKVPMLIFARNRSLVGKSETVGVPPIVMMRLGDLFTLERKSYKPSERKNQLWTVNLLPMFKVVNDAETRVVFTLADFFRFIGPPYKSPHWKKWRRDRRRGPA